MDEYRFQCECCDSIVEELGENLHDAEFHLMIAHDWLVERSGDFVEYYCKECKQPDGYTYEEVTEILDWKELRDLSKERGID